MGGAACARRGGEPAGREESEERVSSNGRSAERGHHIELRGARGRLQGKRFVELFTHGSLCVELFAPGGVDTQQPHTRDEVYVIIHGRGDFVFGDRRVTFGAGDVLFVPAGIAHRFEQFSDDLMTWVLFYGPAGGEDPQ